MRCRNILHTHFFGLVLCVCLFASFAKGADFTVVPLQNTPDIAVYEVAGNYDAEMPDGSTNVVARQQIAREFYKAHPDDLDFLVIFANFDFQMPQDEALAFYQEIKNDVRGIGKELINTTSLYGSSGVLQGTIDMGNINSHVSDPLDSGFSDTMGTLSHELLHRWAADVTFRNEDNSNSRDLLGKGGCHWSFLLDTAGSLEYGNRWVDNGNGTFTALAGRRYFSPLDMYLMGLVDKNDVPPMLLIDNPEIDPQRVTEPGVTIEGTPRYVSIDQIIAAEGERIPGVADSPKTFRVGCVFLTRPGTYAEADLLKIRNIMQNWSLWYSGLTSGLAKIVIDSDPLQGLPGNPGPDLPPIDPRSAPPEISEGIAWLLQHQQEDGSWQDSGRTATRDTAAALHALADFSTTGEATARGIFWLENAGTENLDFLARKIELLGGAGQEVTGLVAELLDRQNSDGGWGSNNKYTSSSADTALALQALAAAGETESPAVEPAIAYLLQAQNNDSGWGTGEDSSVQTTVAVISALIPFRVEHQLDIPLHNGLSWVYARQNPDGGFGNPGTVYETALALLALQRMGIATGVTDLAVAYLLAHQAGDGSWQASAWQTALAVYAVGVATRDPDLSISTADMVPTPATITSLPSALSLAVTVHNSGTTDVAEARVVLYEGAVSDAGRIGEQLVAVAGRSAQTVVFDTEIASGRPHHYYVVVDPDNRIKESSEQNNSALRIIYPESTYEFAVAPEQVTIAPPAATIFEPLTITARVANNGTVDGVNVPLHLVADKGAGPLTMFTRAINLPAGESIETTLTWVPEFAGENISLSLVLDPYATYVETDEDNNRATLAIDINGSTKPDLTLSSADISSDPAPAEEAGNTTLKARVRNRGFSPATAVRVDFTDGVPGQNGSILLGSATIPVVAPGESVDAVFDWRQIPVSGARVITVSIDPDNQVEEIKEDNNSAFTTLQVLTLPDFAVSDTAISFNPEAPHEGDPVTVAAVVYNRGEQATVNVVVSFRAGGAMLATAIIPEIAANGQNTAEITFDSAGKVGIIDVEVVVDPDNTILEQDRTNNRAVRSVGVQNGDLWLSNSYISPNGDGIKDDARFGCRLAMAQDVTVALVNEKGETVREYAGPDFQDTAYVSLTWDGLDNSGRVVDDGPYRIQVLGNTGTVIASLLVTVDTNRSPLLKAMGTPYLFTAKVEYLLGDNKYNWLPDDSGVIFFLETKKPERPEYETGIYWASPTGSIMRLVPEEWSVDADPEIGYRYVLNNSDCNTKAWMFTEYDQVNPGFSLSGDGYTVAFILEKYNKTTSQILQQQLWIADRYGDNLTLIDTFDYINGDNIIITDIFLSPDGRRIAYKLFDQSTSRHFLTIVRNDGAEKKIYTPEWGNDIVGRYRIRWSPDSQKFIYTEVNRIVVADISSNLQQVMEVDSQDIFFDWYGSSKILVRVIDNDNFIDSLIIDLNTDGPPRLIAENLRTPHSLSWYGFDDCLKGGGSNTPLLENGYFIAGYKQDVFPTIKYVVCNVEGLCADFDMFHDGWPYPSLTPDAKKLVVNDPDSSTVIFELESNVSELYWFGGLWGCDGYGYFKEYYNIQSQYIYHPPPEEDCQDRTFLEVAKWNWLDNETFLAYYYGSRHKIIAFNISNGDRTIFRDSYDASKLELSPHKRYISFLTRGDNKSNTFSVSGSLLNLTAEVSPSKTESAVNLQGIATDLNFGSWQLEYADRKAPDDWHIITPPMENPVVNGLLATWIPPYEGSFLVRLTVTDKAGNTGWDRKVVTWGKKFSVTDIYKTGELFSPNGDGVKDTVGLNYTVHEPVHLELSVHDQDGTLIRTFNQDHALPGEYGIVWDGRDESGGIVPDGYYTIRIFDYEFFVQVDTTPPDAQLQFSSVSCGKDPALRASLFGLALDANLKAWTVSYGDGDEPLEWLTFKSGETALATTATSGIDFGVAVIQTFSSESSPSIGFLGNTTFRIVAEDFAGNQSVIVARFNEELLVLSGWDGNSVKLEKNEVPGYCESPDLLPIGFLAAGIHTLEVVETHRELIRSATVQYRMHMQWHDAGVIFDPPDGAIELTFDTTALVPEEIAAVRVKFIDDSGLEYYSNAVLFNPPRFSAVMGCIPVGSLSPALISLDVSLPERLEILKFQAMKTVDGASAWDDLAEYAVFDGFPYQFAAPKPEGLPSGYGYPVRFVGMGESGRVYTSNQLASPKQCEQGGGGGNPPPEPFCGKTTLEISYSEEKAPCNSANDGPATIAVWYCPDDEPKILPDTVKYYLEENGQWRFLKQFQPGVEGWGSVTLATAGLSEGKHGVRVDLVYGESVVEGFRGNTLLVDRTLPWASITYPALSAPFCARRVENEKGEVSRFVDIEGVAADANDISGYSIAYGRGPAADAWFNIKQGVPCSPAEGDCEYLGSQERYGQLGTWDITELELAEHSLQLMVTDKYGNTSCAVSQARIDTTMSLDAAVDSSLFSPNGDGVQDAVAIEYQVGEYAILEITVRNDTGPVRTLVANLEVGNSSGSIAWDGLEDAGMTVADGNYRIHVVARDSCGNQQEETFPVTVDNTPPTAMILSPGTEEPLDVIIEVIGTVTDTHLAGYRLQARNESGGEPILLDEGDIFVDNGVLGLWNTFGLTGNWALVLSAEDRAGNTRTTTLPVSFGERPQLISSLKAEPKVFSPNGDGQFETTTVTYELTDTINSTVVVEDLLGNPLASESTPNMQEGSHQFLWTGLDAEGNSLPDGNYKVKVTAESVSPPFVAQTEKITVVIDTTAPAIEIAAPLDASYHGGVVAVRGALRDQNLREYQVTLTGGQEPYVFGTAVANSGIVFSDSLDLPDGEYAVQVEARDAVENVGSKNVFFTVDKTRPSITLESPVEGEYFGGDRAEIAIRGSIVETNLQTWRAQYGSGTNPVAWTDLASGETLPPDTLLATWDVGPDQAVADGDYTIRIIAVDKAGGESEARVGIHVDNNGPELNLTAPEEGGYVKEPFAILGMVNDAFLKEYTLKLAGSACATAANWSLLRSGSQPIPDGTIAALQALPVDGVYCLCLAAEDHIGNAAEQQVNFTIDTTPPAPPVLSGSLESGTGVSLQWQGNSEPDLAGYNLYRNNGRINAGLLHETAFLDQDLEAGTYAYTVRAVDLAGWESADSNREVFTVDLTPPEAMITSPRDGSRVGNYVDITGRAYSADDFKEYRVFCGFGENPQSWQMLRSSPVPVSYGVLVRWDAIYLADGLYTIMLEAEDVSGNINVKTVSVTVDNTPPAAPVLLAATPDGSTVDLVWQANAEPDLAGYLVYRSGQLVNEDGPVVGDLVPYLVSGLGIEDVDVPDGTHAYYLVAMDHAGNMSDQSNIIQVPIDTHPPHLHIISPSARLEFDQPIPVRAESEDTDIAAVRFQYRPSAETVWTDLGSALSQRPYVVNLDPSALGWENGFFRVRAVATDMGGLSDMLPEEVEIHFKDITPPPAPEGMSARVNGGLVTLSWDQSQATDLAGYNVYLGPDNVKRNAALLTGTSYLDPAGSTTGLADGQYEYAITAVDTSGNESEKSPVTATVFTPLLNQPPTPVNVSTITVDGKTLPGATVEIFRNLAAGTESLGTSQANGQGLFAQAVSLTEKDNSMYAVATDADTNISRPSLPIVVFLDLPPATPTGLAAVADQYDVGLSWNVNTEPDLAGYNIYRTSSTDWQKINPSQVAASSFTDAGLKNNTYTYQVTAVDSAGNESGPSNESSARIEQQRPAPPANLAAVSVPEGGAIDLCWDSSPDPVDGYLLYQGLVSGGPYARVNNSLTPDSCYRDSGLTDGTVYFYVVRAVDSFGNESSDSNEDSAVAQDVITPEKPLILLPTVSGRPYQSSAGRIDVAGFTEAGVLVELIHNQEWVETVYAQKDQAAQETFFLTNYPRIFETIATPDGKSVYYSMSENSSSPYSYYIYQKDLATGAEERVDQIPEGSWDPMVSPDGTKIAYCYEDDAGHARIGIYDRDAGTAAQLITATDVEEYDPAWSKDGTKIVFDSDRGDGFYDIWMHDLPSGETSRVTQNFEGYYPEISPDGQKISFMVWDNVNNQYNLYLVDATGGTPVLLDADVDWSGYYPSVEWSPRANKLAFSANRDGFYDIYVFDIDTGETSRLTDTEDTEIYPQWSPDGRHISSYVHSGGETEVRMISTDGHAEDLLLHSFAGSVASDFNWLPSGIFYRVGSDLHQITPPGTFIFNGVGLHAGQNIFTARAEDAAGNASEPADEIIVQIDAAAMADLEVLEQDISVLPNAPLVGEQATVGAVVRNRSAVVAENVRAEIYIWDAEDNIELIHAETLPHLAPYAEEWLSVNWDSTSMVGTNTVFVLLDPEHQIAESQEENNFASRNFFVAEEAGITFETTLNGNEFGSDEIVSIEIDMQNSGQEKNVRLTVTIEDENGVPVEELAVLDKTLPYGGNERIELGWDAGSVFAETYQVRTVLVDTAGGLLGEQVKPFTVLPDIDVNAVLTMDRMEYGPDENVSLALSVANRGTNFIIPELKAKLTIADSAHVQHVEEHTLANLFPRDSASLTTNWNTARNAPGRYTAAVEIFMNNERIAASSTEFEIVPVMGISGNLSVEPKMIFRNGGVKVGFSVAGSGNVEAGEVLFKLLILDASNWTAVTSHEETITLGINETVSGQHEFPPLPWNLGEYQVLLQSIRQGTIESLASDFFTVRDGVPPVIIVQSPADGTILSESFDLTVTATDDAAGVAMVEYQRDNGAWLPLPLVNPATGRYGGSWQPDEADEGPHTVRFRAADHAGNESLPAASAIVIQPRVEMTTATDKTSCGMNEDMAVRIDLANVGWEKHLHLILQIETQGGAVVAQVADEELVLAADGQQSLNYIWQTGTVDAGTYNVRSRVLKNGAVLAENLVPFSLIDITPPVVTVISPEEGTVVVGPTELAAAAADDGSGVDSVEYSIDQGTWQPLPVHDPAGDTYSVLWTPLETDEGNRTISFRGRDKAGNTSEPVAVAIEVELCKVFADLAGSLNISPEPLYYRQDVVLAYTLTNPCNTPLDGLNIKVAVLDPTTGAIVHEDLATANIAAAATTAGSFVLSSSDLQVQQYTVLLEIYQADNEPRRLAESSFEVLSTVEGENKPLAQTNLLVWFNNGQESCQEEGCPAFAHLETILGEATDNYRIVCSRDDFEHELRNPFHTDIMIIGDQHQLTDHHDEELREKVHSGTGLISFGWHVPGDDPQDDGNGHNDHKESFLGVTVKGVLPRSDYSIMLAASTVSQAGLLPIHGQLAQVESADDTEVVGWIIDDCRGEDENGHGAKENGDSCVYPVIVLHEYGLGQTVYTAFDLCDAFNDLNDEQLTALLANAIGFVHRPDDSSELVPYQIRPFALEVTSPGLASDLLVRTTCPAGITLFDPASDDWIREYPWEAILPVQSGEPALLPYYVLAPDQEGVFTCEFNTGFVEGSQYTILQKFIYDFAVHTDRISHLEEAIEQVGNLDLSKYERAMRDNALRYLRNVLARTATHCEQTELNIHDIEKAVDALIEIESVEIGDIRLQLDTLLRIEQGRCYFYE